MEYKKYSRLKPIRGRDVSKPASKMFIPCIPQRRHRVEEEKAKDVAESAKTDTCSERGSRRDRGRGRGQKEYIQLTGSLFGEGPSVDKSLKKVPREYSSRDVKTIPLPVYKSSEKKTKEEKIKGEEVVENLLADNITEDEYGQKKPMFLPLADFADKKIDVKGGIYQKIKIKEKPSIEEGKLEIKNKEDDVKAEIQKIPYGDTKCDVPLNKERIKEQLFRDFFTEMKNSKGFGRSMTCFFQFPSALLATAVQNLAEKSVPNEAKGKDESGSTGSGSESKPGTNESLSLVLLKDGKIGKIQILKSGKMQMILDKFVLGIERGSSVSFREEVAIVKGESNSTNVTNLGHIEKHLVCYPIYI